MDELYRFHSSINSNFLGDGSNTSSNSNNNNSNSNNIAGFSDHYYINPHSNNNPEIMVLTAADHEVATTTTGLAEMSDLIKAQIANHPLYPELLSAYIDCRKVGAPEEMASLLEEINTENNHTTTHHQIIGADPQLDDFMRSYCEVLQKYKEELSKPFDEATNFLSIIESQLTLLCNQTLPSSTHPFHSDEVGVLSEENMMNLEGVEYNSNNNSNEGDNNTNNNKELKEMLMRKYSGYLSTLKKEFLKKRKKGKLPKDALTALLDWWNTHYRWPYPTEEEKNRLSEMTGLDQKQINNWFINQRKRHWRPSEDMRFALMEGVSDGSTLFDANNNNNNGGLGT
ncbi:hypothetical protein ABFS82_02G091500 [Erythranthe guttata]|uniref:homeobox protein knotted-1-like 1 n=1 Tax=Erythranthe guttata TaxID=4155 RepID=UPI00064D83C7|nr:PREDICTED: homeobox protein knotted-1-like 1 [Erythranthe guttata]|eukprot:XP_012840397.1 PREDICTED: homeobox protein knotted-1-like 1 [Erythranthe guttata]